MSNEEKKERRKVRHDLQNAALRNHFSQHKFSATNSQLAASAKKVADQILSGKTPGTVVKIA